MVRSVPTCVESKIRHNAPFRPLFGTLEGFCSCGCGGRLFRWVEGSPLSVCFRTMAGVRELIHRAPLSATQKHLLHVFLHHTRDQRECWPSGLRLLESTGLQSRQTLSTHKKALRELGILGWLRPGHPENPRSCALYQLSWEALQALVEAQVCEPAPRSRSWSMTPPAVQQQAEQGDPESGTTPSTQTADLAEQEPQMGPPDVESEDNALVLDEVLSRLPTADEWLPSVEEMTALPPAAELADPAPEPPAREPAVSLVPAASAPAQESPTLSLPRSQEPSFSFVVSVAVVWNLWRESYQRVYGRPYVQTASDKPAAREIAEACTAAVLHHEQRAGLSASEREPQANTYLRHVFSAFLQRAGRRDFLRERRHPLSLLPEDLNALGEPWSKERKTAAPEPAPLPPPLSREEQLARCRQVKQALTEARVTARPRILKNG